MAISMKLDDLLEKDESLRDEEWEKAFFQVFPSAQLKVLNESPQPGPDSWPYLMVSTEPGGTEPALRVLEWLSDKGIGLVVNPQKNIPDYVFTYGMIWNYRQTGRFLSDVRQVRTGPVKFEKGEKVLAGPPTDDYLPPFARGVLREFFRQQNIRDMKILVLGAGESEQNNQPAHYDLCFSYEALGSPAPTEHHGILEAISWFLPSHYSLIIVSEKDLPPFHSL